MLSALFVSIYALYAVLCIHGLCLLLWIGYASFMGRLLAWSGYTHIAVHIVYRCSIRINLIVPLLWLFVFIHPSLLVSTSARIIPHSSHLPYPAPSTHRALCIIYWGTASVRIYACSIFIRPSTPTYTHTHTYNLHTYYILHTYIRYLLNHKHLLPHGTYT